MYSLNCLCFSFAIQFDFPNCVFPLCIRKFFPFFGRCTYGKSWSLLRYSYVFVLVVLFTKWLYSVFSMIPTVNDVWCKELNPIDYDIVISLTSIFAVISANVRIYYSAIYRVYNFMCSSCFMHFLRPWGEFQRSNVDEKVLSLFARVFNLVNFYLKKRRCTEVVSY